MSGGVDSTITAHLLKADGYEVVGLHLIFGRIADSGVARLVAPPSAEDAAQAAAALGVECHVLDCRDEFWDIVSYFCRSYTNGLTPNPCVLCNPTMKFRKLCEFADQVGAQHIATGHYARVARRHGRLAIHRGADSTKDQSYVLHRLTQNQLARLTLPLGDRRKDDMRAMAHGLGLQVAGRPGSQEVCFAPGQDHTAVLRALCQDTPKPGPILDTAGKVLGQHPGIQFFTIGQRRGLGIALGTPRYVVELDPSRNAVIIGTVDELDRGEALVADVNWMAIPQPPEPIDALIQIRYNHEASPATLTPYQDGRILVSFHTPQPAVTPGQAAVFYDDEVVLGGGWIERG